jgi:RNA polymerase sigma-70 factor (ECF subfamily)
MTSDAEIIAAHTEGTTIWPDVVVPFEDFNRMLRDTNVTSDGMRQWPGDLYLACAARHGNARAIRIIDERFVAGLGARIRRLGSKPEEIADVLQAVRERLFAGDAPRIGAYNANGPLEQWIKVVAMRTAIDTHRKEATVPRAEAAWLEIFTAAASDASVLLIRTEYKRELETAIQEQVATLSAHDRAVLRLHVIEGVSIEKIAASYGVHRVTVARWVWKAGESILDGLRRRFNDRFGIVPQEFESLARLARSQLSLNLRDLLEP